jgi:hypothetical protein
MSSPETELQSQSQASASTPAASSTTSSSGSASGVKGLLRGHDYATQVQMLAPGGGEKAPDVHAAAAQGVSGGGGALPYAAQIQRSFGGYDISNVQAHTDAAAAKASASMGANAYATGNHVVLGDGGKDLHTVAHEAAHVVQQRAGVQLSGGVGKAGDAYEQHADKVADAVVAGKSAEPILAEMAGGASSGAVQQKAVQRQAPRTDDRTVGVSEQVSNANGDAAADAAGMATSANGDSDVEAPALPFDHPVWPRFRERVFALFSKFKGAEADPNAVAESLWLNFFTALQGTNAEYDATVARKVTINGRLVDNLNSAKARELASKFDPLVAQLSGYAGDQIANAESVAFYSNGCARKLAESSCDLTLETSLVGVLFDGLKMSGDWDMHLWGALSQAYATALMKEVHNKRIHVFCGPFTNDQNVFNSFEQRALRVGAREQNLRLMDILKAHAVAAADPGAKDFDTSVATGDFVGTIASYKQVKRACDKSFEYWDGKFGAGAAATSGSASTGSGAGT